ncbi:uncharacterized protein N7518_009954 [Penicillium psychrosexuale]|uniref:uncharacterized protein n=1 Tax=Penicillium psychrosexuale TaxID=1002107 RepID=UPI0025451DF2|nr:uncharacterized protein N7518_009954 [Penicillium psychrosexuale]KAJ5781471.1 hypothetical protein N7518_009954 [Penicillium psychrosexuale]
MPNVPASISVSETGSSMSTTSAKQFDSLSAFEDHVLSSLRQVESSHDFLFTDVPEFWGTTVFQHIDEKIPSQKTHDTKNHTLRIKVKPTEVHNCIQNWLVQQMIDWLLNQDITQNEQSLLRVAVGTTLQFRSGPYRNSRKEPDFFFRVDGHIMPTIAVECVWSQSIARLHNDMNLLLVGGDGSIRVVIIIKWRKLQGCVSGTVELFERDRNGMPILQQSETIFPRPANGNSQQLEIRRRDIFGPALPAGSNGNDILYLNIEQLRSYAVESLHFMNLVPA